MELCPVCRGRGEVAAGVSTGLKEHWDGSAEPIAYRVNPAAYYPKIKDVWLLETNPYGKLWGIAICRECRGTGLKR